MEAQFNSMIYVYTLPKRFAFFDRMPALHDDRDQRRSSWMLIQFDF